MRIGQPNGYSDELLLARMVSLEPLLGNLRHWLDDATSFEHSTY
jgi:hypothetical protein